MSIENQFYDDSVKPELYIVQKQTKSVAKIPFNVQLFEKKSPMTKTISHSESGGLVKDSSGCTMPLGVSCTLSITLPLLAKLITIITSTEALGLSNKDFGDNIQDIITQNKQLGNKIARTKEYFPFIEGTALILIDIDFSQYYPERTLKQASNDIEAFLPIKSAAKVINHSTSSHISTESGEVLSGASGYHVYSLVEDGNTLNDAKDLILKRAWLSGQGIIYITRDGKLLLRCPIDLSVISAERLIFEGAPTLKDGLVQNKPPPEFIDGDFLNLEEVLKPLTAEQEDEYQKLVSEAKAKAELTAAPIREKYRQNETATLISNGLTKEQAATVVADRMDGEINPDDILYFDHLSDGVSAEEALEHPERYNDKSLRDPCEPEKGRAKAKFYANDGNPCINSFCHGGIVYKFKTEPKDIEHKLIKNIAYLSDHDRFYNMTDGSNYTPQALNRTFAHEFDDGCATNLLSNSKDSIKASTITFMPGCDTTITKDRKNRNVVNTWQRNHFETVDDNITIYHDHLDFIIPDKKEQKHLLDWMAFCAQNRGIKINHAVLLGGATRIGKDTIFEPLRHCIGRWLKEPSADVLKERYDDWLHEAEIVMFQEVKAFEGYAGDIENRLKPVLAAPPETLTIRLFAKGFYETPNLVKGIFMTNYRNALHISEGDERYFALWSPAATPQSEAYYTRLWQWLDNGGRAAVAHYLLQRDVSHFNPNAGAPMTAYKLELMKSSKSPLRFKIEEMISDHICPFDKDIIHTSVLKQSLTKNFGMYKASEKAIGEVLQEMGYTNKNCKYTKLDGKRGQKSLWCIRNEKKWAVSSHQEWIDEHTCEAAIYL